MRPPGPALTVLVAEDDARLYLAKPAGLPVFPPHADPDGDCLLARLLAERPGRAEGWPEGFSGGIAHRLDTATSGLVVAARTLADLAALRAQFAGGLLAKHYVFHSAGEVPFDERVITTPIAHHPRRKDRMVVQGGPRTTHRGRWYPAWTRLARGLREGAWDAEIRTGVTHQIRVHAASVGLPLTGDALYGGAPGPFRLHAARIVGPGWASPELPTPW